MKDGGLAGRHYATGEPVRIEWTSGRLSSIEPFPASRTSLPWIAPPVFDLQVNGFGGIDFQRDDLSTDQLLVAARALRDSGCARFLLTLITDAWPDLLRRLKHIRTLRNACPELHRAIAGWHVEGPFLSTEPGYHGAHNPAHMLDPSPTHLDELRAVTAQDPLLLTLAPERPGAMETIRAAVQRGIRVSLGHTNADEATLLAAATSGATGFTHLGNACPQTLDRHDNLLWRVLDTPGLTVGLIPDAIHVSPALFRLIHRLIPTNAIYYTTDAMAAGGAPPGRYTIGSLELEVGEDQIVRQPGRSNFAGSALRPVDGLRRAAAMLNQPWQRVWDRFSINPSRFMGLPTGFAIGDPAEFSLIGTDSEGGIARIETISSSHTGTHH